MIEMTTGAAVACAIGLILLGCVLGMAIQLGVDRGEMIEYERERREAAELFLRRKKP